MSRSLFSCAVRHVCVEAILAFPANSFPKVGEVAAVLARDVCDESLLQVSRSLVIGAKVAISFKNPARSRKGATDCLILRRP